MPYHRHNACEIYLFIRGNTRLYIEQSCFQLCAGSLAVINPNELHRSICLDEQPYERYCINIKQELIEQLSSHHTNLFACFNHFPGKNNLIQLTNEQIAEFIALFNSLEAATSFHDYGFDLLLQAEAIKLLVFINRLYNQSECCTKDIMPPLVKETMAHEYNVRDIWVVNVGDIKPLEMELNYCMDLAYDMDKWGQENTAEKYRQEWIQKQLGGKANCPDDVAKGVADCVADFLKISTYRKPEYVSSKLYSTTNYNEAQEVLDLCLKTIEESNYYYNTYFKGTKWDDAFYQLVYYQAVGTANVTQMQIFKSLSDFYASQKSSLANTYYDLVQKCVAYDKELTSYYNNTMSNKKWNKMMSSPHVGFVTWNSTGWKYPTGTQVTLEENAKMIVSVDGDSKGYQTGKATLPTFTNTQKQRYCVTMSNAGQKEYGFTVEAKEDWIQITDKRGEKAISGGTVADAEYFYVAIDWSKVTADASGTILVKGTNATVEITIKADYTKYKDKGVNTHIESNDVVTIDAAEYSKKVDSANGVSWGCINGYGRYQSAMKMFPTTVSFTEKTGNTYKVTVTLSKTKPYTVKKLKYKITKLGKNKEVSLVAPTSKKAQKAVIPAQVSIKGMKFKVTSIAKKAFLNNKKLSSVTIGSQISKIGAQAFQGCKKLKKIVIQSPKMSVVGKKAFQGVPKKATVKVPKKSLKNYKKLLRVQQKYKFAIHQI